MLLRSVSESIVWASEAPPSVLEGQRQFARCLGCKRLYWEGSHTARMRQTLERALASRWTDGATGAAPIVDGVDGSAGREDPR